MSGQTDSTGDDAILFMNNLKQSESIVILFSGKMLNGEKGDLNVKDQEHMINFIKRPQETYHLLL